MLIRNVDDAVLHAVRTRAAARGVSLEAELREALTRSAGYPRADLAAEFAAVRAQTPRGRHRLAEDLVRETRPGAMTLVIDASVALKWFVDEDGPDQAAWLLTGLDSLIAPDLIVADLCNAGWKAVRGGGMTEA